MADDVNIRLKAQGGHQVVREADMASNAIGRISRRARTGIGDMRLFSRASIGAAGGMRMAAGAAVYGGAAIGGVLLIGLKRTTDAWEESRRVTADTAAVLKSTGGVAHVTARDVATLSTQLSRRAGVDDELIQSGENVLLTFTRVRNEVGKGNAIFDRASASAVDMSARFGTDVRSAFVQVGKALDDPIRGVTALRRVGVTFTESEQEKIKALEESGQHLEAQRLILAALDRQVKGSAAAQATPMKRLGVTWGNIQETIGKGVSPAVDALADRMDGFLRRSEPKVDRLGKRLRDIWGGKADTGMKFFMSRRVIEKEFGPLGDQIGDTLGDAFEKAGPRIADAAGKAAGRAAGAFLRSFWNADVGGKLFLAGVVAWKLGTFKTAANLAFGAFLRQWRRHHLPPLPTDAPTLGRPGRGKPGGGALRGARKALPLALAAGADAPLLAIPGAFFAGAEWREDHGANHGRNVPGPGRRVRSPTTTSGAFQYNRPRVAAPHGRGDIVIHNKTYLDGKEVSKSTLRHALDAKANRRGG